MKKVNINSVFGDMLKKEISRGAYNNHLDDLYTPGVYQTGPGTTGLPDDVVGGSVIVFEDGAATSRRVQLHVSNTNPAKAHLRRVTQANVWGNWVELT